MSSLSFVRVISLAAGFGNVSALVGTRRDGEAVISRLSLSEPLTAGQLADVASRLVAEYESVELVAPLEGQRLRTLPTVRPISGPSPMTLELAASIAYAGIPAMQRTLDAKA